MKLRDALRAFVVRAGLRAVMAVGLSLVCAARPALAGDRRARFDIPAAALADALYAYSTATGIEVLVSRDMVAHRRSATLAGSFAPEQALQALLSGSGLSPRYIGANAFTLVPEGRGASWYARPRYPDYSAALQAALTQVLCRFSDTRPGDYRVAVRLWVGSSGAVRQVRLIGTTGDDGRDATLASLLGRVVVGAPPPADLVQPTTLLILPRRDESAECGGHGGSP